MLGLFRFSCCAAICIIVIHSFLPKVFGETPTNKVYSFASQVGRTLSTFSHGPQRTFTAVLERVAQLEILMAVLHCLEGPEVVG